MDASKLELFTFLFTIALPIVVCVAVLVAIALRQAVLDCTSSNIGTSIDYDAIDKVPATPSSSTNNARRGVVNGDNDNDNDNDSENDYVNDGVPLLSSKPSVQSASSRLRVAAEKIAVVVVGVNDKRIVEHSSFRHSAAQAILFILHVSFFGSVRAVLGNFSCASDQYLSESFMNRLPWLRCSFDSPAYWHITVASGIFGLLYIVLFPVWLAVLVVRHNKRAQAIGSSSTNRVSSPLASMVGDDLLATDRSLVASPFATSLDKATPTVWYAMLLKGWAQRHPYAELLWMLRRFLLAATLSLVASNDLRLVLVVAQLSATLLAQQRWQLAARAVDHALDALVLWALLITYVFANQAAANHGGGAAQLSASTVVVALLNGAVGLCLLCAVLWHPLFVHIFKRMQRKD